MENRILGVLAGRDLPPDRLKKWAQNATILFAADSGAELLWEVDYQPSVIVGDFDSLALDRVGTGSKIYKIDDQNRSDCDKLLDFVAEQGYHRITLAGVEGDRLDHLLASLSSIVRSSLDIQIATRDGVARVLRAGDHRLTLDPGRRISFMPMIPALKLTLSGVKWPLSEVTLSFGDGVSLSNIVSEPVVRVRFATGTILACINYSDEELPVWPDSVSG